MAHLGLQLTSFTYPGVSDDRLFEGIAASALAAERAGFDSLWVMDHFEQIPGAGERTEPMLEAYTLLGALGALTSRVHLGALVTGVMYRNPALLAKVVTTLDVVTSGRAMLGIGAAWHEDEAHAYGYDFPPLGERMDRLEDTLRICRAMFSEPQVSLTGTHHRVEGALNYPQPVQRGGPRILVGGGGERRTLRLVARYADFSNFFGSVDEIRHKLAVLDRHCEAVGRDPKEITRTRLGTVAVGATQADAERTAAAAAATWPWGEDAYRATAWIGDVDGIAARAREFLDAGLDGLIVYLPDGHDVDAIGRAGAALRAAAGVVEG